MAFWIPTYITEQFHVVPATSSAITSVLPIFNLIGTFLGLKLLKKCKENEYEVSILLFAVSMAMFFLMSLTRSHYFILTIIALFLANAAMASACNMVFSVYCLRFRQTGRVSAITGFLDAVSYLFAALASPIFSVVVSKTNWNTTVFIWGLLKMCIRDSVKDKHAIRVQKQRNLLQSGAKVLVVDQMVQTIQSRNRRVDGAVQVEFRHVLIEVDDVPAALELLLQS